MLMTAAWVYLLIAGILEVFWATGLKYTNGFTRLGPSLAVLAGMAVSFYCLSQACKALPIGTAYAVWTGIGAAGTALLGILFFQESAQFLRILCILLIIAGTVGLKIFSK